MVRLKVTKQELMKSLQKTQLRFRNIRQDALDTMIQIQHSPDIETNRVLKTRLSLLIDEGMELQEQCKSIESMLYPDEE